MKPDDKKPRNLSRSQRNDMREAAIIAARIAGDLRQALKDDVSPAGAQAEVTRLACVLGRVA